MAPPEERPRVLFTRALTPAQRAFAERLGVTPVVCPLIATRRLGSARHIARELARTKLRTWVFTSAKAARAARAALALLPREKRPDKLLALGRKTAAPLRGAGLPVVCRGGSAARLGGYLARRGDFEGAAHWQGTRARPELRAALCFARKSYFPLVVYRTAFTETSPRPDGCEAAAFMSPSAVRAFARAAPDWPAGIAAVAIGRTTARAFRDAYGFSPEVAGKPAFEAAARRAAELAAGNRFAADG